jgi:hypothetical protein
MFFHDITYFQQMLKMFYLVKMRCQVAFTVDAIFSRC